MRSLERPVIDVVIPAYNAENFICEAIRSVFNQSLQPQTVFVVDDGSTDRTIECVESLRGQLESEFPMTRLKLIFQNNQGPSFARNAGIKASTADYIALLDADDLWEHRKLERQWDVYQKSEFSNLGLVYCNYSLIDQDGKELKGVPHFSLDPSVRGQVLSRLLEGNLIASSNSGVLIKRECFKKVGLFDESLRAAEDWDMWIRISQSFEFDYTPDSLVRIRRSKISNSTDPSRMFYNDLRMLWKHYSKDPSIVMKIVRRTIIRTGNLKLLQALFDEPHVHGLQGLVETIYPRWHQKTKAKLLMCSMKFLRRLIQLLRARSGKRLLG